MCDVYLTRFAGYETLTKLVTVDIGNRSSVLFSLNHEVSMMRYHDYASMYKVMVNITRKCPGVSHLVR